MNIEIFLALWSPYWEHVREAWEKKDNENVCFLFYENLNEVRHYYSTYFPYAIVFFFQNLRTTITLVANFLGKTLTDAQMNDVENHLKFENFRNNRCVNSNAEIELGIFRKNEGNYIRKGMKNGWIEYFDENMLMEANRWIEINERKIGIKFPE